MVSGSAIIASYSGIASGVSARRAAGWPWPNERAAKLFSTANACPSMTSARARSAVVVLLMPSSTRPVIVGAKRSLISTDCGSRANASSNSLIPSAYVSRDRGAFCYSAAPQNVVLRIGILGGTVRFSADQRNAERIRDPAGNLVSQLEQVGCVAVEAFRP